MFKLNKTRNETYGYAVFKVFNIIFMVAVIAVTLCPYLNVLAKALNDGQDSMRGGIYLWPRKVTLENFRVLLADSSLYLAAVVTILRVVIATLLSLLVQFMTAYALSKKLKGFKIVNLYFMVPMFLTGGIIPLYILFSSIGLLNNFWVYIIPWLFNFYYIIIIRSYIQTSIPDSVIEAAQIDGVGEWGMLFRMVLPLSKPILATIALWIIVYNWNDWSATLYYIDNTNLHTLQYKLMQTIKETERMNALIQEAIQSGQDVEGVINSMKVTTDSMVSAQIIVVTLPVICIYPFLQKYFVHGITLGAVKG